MSVKRQEKRREKRLEGEISNTLTAQHREPYKTHQEIRAERKVSNQLFREMMKGKNYGK